MNFAGSIRVSKTPNDAHKPFRKIAERPFKLLLTLWSYAGSNRKPPACKAGALPVEL